MTLPGDGRSAPLPPRAARRAALAWAAATFLLAFATAPAQGISRDEGIHLAAGEARVAWLVRLVLRPREAFVLRDVVSAVGAGNPPLAETVSGLAHAALRPLGLSHLQAARAGAFLFAALLAALLALLGNSLAGAWGAALAPALFWLVPRHFHHAHPALPDLALAVLWLATAAAWRACLRAEQPRRARRLGIATGLLFGLALATGHGGWFLAPILFAHGLASRGPARWSWRAWLRAVPPAVPAMLVLGPLLLLALWPWLWADPAGRLREYLASALHHEHHPWRHLPRFLRELPFPAASPLVVTGLTVPAATLAAMAGGLLHSSWNLIRASIARDRAAAADEVWLLLNAVFPLALGAWPSAPVSGGVERWLAAMPFLALLGARALEAAGRTLWPPRARGTTAALALLVLAPAGRMVARIHPHGTAAYNELAGLAPGAASLGLQRQLGGDAPAGLLDSIDAHAAPGARIWWQETSGLAVQAWQRDGRLRRDLAWASGPEDADISLFQYQEDFRDREFRTWSAFRTARPVDGLFLDEVPLVVVYARPGSWR